MLTSRDDGSLAFVDIATGAVRPVTVQLPGAGVRVELIVSPDGKRVYFTIRRVEANIWMTEAAGRP